MGRIGGNSSKRSINRSRKYLDDLDAENEDTISRVDYSWWMKVIMLCWALRLGLGCTGYMTMLLFTSSNDSGTYPPVYSQNISSLQEYSYVELMKETKSNKDTNHDNNDKKILSDILRSGQITILRGVLKNRTVNDIFDILELGLSSDMLMETETKSKSKSNNHNNNHFLYQHHDRSWNNLYKTQTQTQTQTQTHHHEDKESEFIASSIETSTEWVPYQTVRNLHSLSHMNHNRKDQDQEEDQDQDQDDRNAFYATMNFPSHPPTCKNLLIHTLLPIFNSICQVIYHEGMSSVYYYNC
jgi:hypothetical protein